MEIWRVQSFNLNGTVFSTEAFDNRADAEAAYHGVTVGAFKRIACRKVGTTRFKLVAEGKVGGAAKAVKSA